jgi:hypothetical protein
MATDHSNPETTREMAPGHGNPDTSLLTAYTAAISLIVAQAADYWSRFQALLLANSVVLAAIPFLIERDKGGLRGDVFVFFVGVLGLLLCYVWRRLLSLGFDNLLYWYMAGNELEAKINTFDILRRHLVFTQGNAVQVCGTTMQISGKPTLAARWAGRIVWLFVVGYLLALMLVLWPLWPLMLMLVAKLGRSTGV